MKGRRAVPGCCQLLATSETYSLSGFRSLPALLRPGCALPGCCRLLATCKISCFLPGPGCFLRSCHLGTLRASCFGLA